MPSTPHLIGIVVKTSAGIVEPNIDVTLHNERTGDELTETSNASGQVLFDCYNFTNGWTNGDYLYFQAEGSGSNEEELRFKIVSRTSGYIRKYRVFYETE